MSITRLRDYLARHLMCILCDTVGARNAAALPVETGLLADILLEDAQACAERDPASGGDPRLVVGAYSAFAAVAHHRLAHALLDLKGMDPARQRLFARRVAERGKLASGADIHPAASIGRRFVLDHAVGTVIGETSRIGDDAYILGGVTLGARGIASNSAAPRHPQIGRRVQIGAGASILGAVNLGDDVFIGPGAIVTDDIPAHSRVTVANLLQLTQSAARDGACRVRAHGVTALNAREGSFRVFGEGFRRPRLALLDGGFAEIHGVRANIVGVETAWLDFCLVAEGRTAVAGRHETVHLRIAQEGEVVVLMKPVALADAMREFRSKPSIRRRFAASYGVSSNDRLEAAFS